ncbi:polyprenyl synthetase family protein [Vibrio sp. WXL210]|uniref:polyprenyl synthetase family protein n=1 Tax=Vibrio sp. WXL210 TaxID=3450709 RepID=UPI003EC4AEA1
MSNPKSILRSTQQNQIYQHCEQVLLTAVSQHEPAQYHLSTGGQRVRMRVCIDASLALGLAESDSVILAAAIELLHNASLIHDDIQDGDRLRRGSPTVWAKYGANVAICTGDLMITKAFGLLAQITTSERLPQLLEVTQQAVAETIYGQLEDITLQGGVSPRDYEEIAARKAGPLLSLPLVLPLLSRYGDTYINTAKRAARNFAIAYQILDDISDHDDDLKCNRLNLLNIYLSDNSKVAALRLTKQRAYYLLKSCERDFSKLPDDCAVGLLQATQHKLAKLREVNDERA